MTIEPGRLARLQAASNEFRLGHHAAVIGALEVESDGGGEMGRALLLTSRALILEQEGNASEAAPIMEEALALGAPLPLVMQEIARFFERIERPMLAHYAFLMADTLTPSALNRFALDQEGSERGRYAPWVLRSSRLVERQDLYGMAPYKSALVERLGADGAAMALAAMDGPAGPRVARERPLQHLIDHAREHGREFKEVIAAGPAESRPPGVFGQPRGERFEKIARSFFTCLIEDVVVCARSDTLLTAGVALLDIQDIDRGPERLEFSVDPVIAAGGADGVFVIEPARPDELRHVPEALWLNGIDSRDFGHWLTEFMPKVWAFMDRPGFAEVPILIDGGMPPNHAEALRFFVGAVHPIITLGREERVHVDLLWVGSKLLHRESVDSEGLVRLLRQAQPVLETVDTSDAPERIFLARTPTQHRRLVNAEPVEAELTSRGYQVIDLAEIPFAEQVRLIRGARHVVGSDRSALLMTLLGRPGLHIGMLSLQSVDGVEGYADICDAMGQDLTVVTGTLETEHDRFHWMSDFHIDMTQLADYLDDVDRQLDGAGDAKRDQPPG